MVSEKALTCENHGLTNCFSCASPIRSAPLIIAECGQNFCGNMELAKKLISLAKENGADLVKFQLYDHNILYKDHPEIPDVALSFDEANMLFDYGEEVGIEVFFSVFDVERVKWCEEIGVKRYKVAYSQSYNIDLLRAIRAANKPILISSDGYQLGQTLYCVPQYPVKLSELHLGDVDFNKLGFSDHTIGLDAAKIALARGAQIIEKHFAIDHQTGVDAQWSMTPEELKELVRWSRVVNGVL